MVVKVSVPPPFAVTVAFKTRQCSTSLEPVAAGRRGVRGEGSLLLVRTSMGDKLALGRTIACNVVRFQHDFVVRDQRVELVGAQRRGCCARHEDIDEGTEQHPTACPRVHTKIFNFCVLTCKNILKQINTY